METTGMPPAGLYGPITMESLQYVLGLQKAAELEEYAGDAALAALDREEAVRVQEAVRKHCTTCVEAEFYARSECHAWGALALYEIPSVILGVRPTAPGYSKVEAKPCPGYLTLAFGTVHTPAGDVKVSWHKIGEKIDLKVSQEIK